MYLKKDGTIQFQPIENAYTSKMFYSELAGGLQEKLPKAPSKFTSQTIKKCCPKISCNIFNDFEQSNAFEEVIKKI